MPQFAATMSVHPNSFEAAAECAGEVLEQLDGNRPDLVVVACTPPHRRDLADVSAGLRKLLECDTLVGTVSSEVAVALTDAPGPGGAAGFAVFAADWGGGRARPLRLEATATGADRRISGWPDDLPASGTLVLFADPLTFPVDDLIAICAQHAPDLEIVGGLMPLSGRGALAIDDSVHERGAVGVLLDPSVGVRAHLAPACRPIGSPFTVTHAEHTVITELAGRAPFARLREAVVAHHDRRGADRDRDHDCDAAIAEMMHSVRVGVVVDEQRCDFGPGDFVLRDVRHIDQRNGAISLSNIVRPGQTVQFHLPDDGPADPPDVAMPKGALVFSPGADASGLGGPARHASDLSARFGRLPLLGMAAAGEIGRVRGRTFVQSGVASIACFA
jgi:small ligand-binding sensory domain FIST